MEAAQPPFLASIAPGASGAHSRSAVPAAGNTEEGEPEAAGKGGVAPGELTLVGRGGRGAEVSHRFSLTDFLNLLHLTLA